MASQTEFDIDLEDYLHQIKHYHTGRAGYMHPRTWDDGIMPLWEFGPDHLCRILDDCDRARPPERWFGQPGLFQMESRSWHEWHWTRGRHLRSDPTYEPRARRHIPLAVRLAVYERDGHQCLHCGATEQLSLDHIHPYSLGGTDDATNLQTLCRSCNSRKGARISCQTTLVSTPE